MTTHQTVYTKFSRFEGGLIPVELPPSIDPPDEGEQRAKSRRFARRMEIAARAPHIQVRDDG